MIRARRKSEYMLKVDAHTFTIEATAAAIVQEGSALSRTNKVFKNRRLQTLMSAIYSQIVCKQYDVISCV